MTKDYFLRLDDGRWFRVEITRVIEEDEEVWKTTRIPKPYSSASTAYYTREFPPADLEVLKIHDVLKMERGTCTVCLEHPSTCRLVCGEPENAAVESRSGCKGSQVCVLCKTQMCLAPLPISIESSAYFIVPVTRRELKCLNNCERSSVQFFEPMGSDGTLYPLVFPFAQLWKRPFGSM